MRSADQFNEAKRLMAEGINDCATARLDEFVGPKSRAVPLNGVHYTA